MKVLVEASDKSSQQQIRSLLRAVLVENSALRSSNSSFDALFSSLEASDSGSLPAQLAFFDNCLCRVVKKPVHYQDLADSLVKDGSGNVSLIVAAINEQWQFVVKNGDAATQESVAVWIARLLGDLKQAGEDEKALKAVRSNLVESTEHKKPKSLLKKALKDAAENQQSDKNSDSDRQRSQTGSKVANSVDLSAIFGGLPVEDEDHSALHKWERQEPEVAVEQGRIGDLILYLCSEHEEIRRQAYAGISRFMTKIKVSTVRFWR